MFAQLRTRRDFEHPLISGQVLVIAAFGCLAISVHYGLGQHTLSLTRKNAQTALRLLWIAFCMTPSAEATAKISISLMLIRITTSTNWKRFFYVLIVFFMTVTIMCFFGIILSCTPIQSLWDPSVGGSCDIAERTGILYVQGSKYWRSFPLNQPNALFQFRHLFMTLFSVRRQ